MSIITALYFVVKLWPLLRKPAEQCPLPVGKGHTFKKRALGFRETWIRVSVHKTQHVYLVFICINPNRNFMFYLFKYNLSIILLFTHVSPKCPPTFSILKRIFCACLITISRRQYIQVYCLYAVPLRRKTFPRTTKDIGSNIMVHNNIFPKRVVVK